MPPPRIASPYPEGGPGRHLKARLRAGPALVGGILTEYARPSLVKVYRQAGFDFLYVEYEHVFFDPVALADTVLCARDNGLPVIAKTPQLERAEVAKLLECGVVGIQLPRTESRAQVEALRDYLKFLPAGSRAVAPGYGNSDYVVPADWSAWMRDQDAETTLVVHIETRAGWERAEEIVSTPGVDMVYLGPGDFSIAMGQPGKYDHPDVVGPMEQVLALCRKYQVPFGTTAASPEAAGRWVARGARFFEAADELSLIHEAASRLVRDYHRAFNAGGDPAAKG
jgi:2-keto-3-deoxy-L-rhamnonate aldolase RhmA